jgi:hypothetical protein
VRSCGWSLRHTLEDNNKMDVKYESESVNWSQMDIKREICDMRTWKRYLFFEIASTNIDTLVPSL